MKKLMVCLLIVFLTTASQVAQIAQIALAQESDQGTEEEEGAPCAVGELCLDDLGSTLNQQRQGTVNDPPGKYARSLITMSAIVLVVGGFLFVALTGKLPIPGRSRSGTGS